MSATRALLAVALATALLAASFPAVDAGRERRATALVDEDLRRLRATAVDLAAESDPVVPTRPGARTTVRVRLPTETWTTEPVASVAVVDGADSGTQVGGRAVDALEYRLPGGRVRRMHVRGVDLAVRDPTGRLVLRAPGVHRLRLRYVRLADGPAVVVGRAGRLVPAMWVTSSETSDRALGRDPPGSGVGLARG